MVIPRPAPPTESPGPHEDHPAERFIRPEIFRPAWAEVDLEALESNLATSRRLMGGARVLAVIKADAYGHGASRVSQTLEAAGVDFLGAALLEEGAEVRRAGVETPVLVLGVPQRDQFPYFRRYRLTPAISGLDQLAQWREYLAGGSYVQKVHLKIDTGMGRLGIAPGEVPQALEILRASKHLELEGVLSHLADADIPESRRTGEQNRLFDDLLGLLTDDERSRLVVHLSNSAGALHHPDCRHDMVRLGLALYGHDPAEEEIPGLRPVMAVKTRIVLTRELFPGDRIGYGGRWEAPPGKVSRIGVLPLGYADGYAWRLSNRSEALVRGRRVPVVGAVSMDMTFIDLADTGAQVGDEVVLLGRQGSERITVVELAHQAGTLPYELLCLLGLRLARRYIRDGEVDDVVSRFERGQR